MLDDESWGRRHRFLQWFVVVHLPLLIAFGLVRGWAPVEISHFVLPPALLLLLSRHTRSRRGASFFLTASLVYCSVALVAFSGGAIEAHFHFFIIIGFIALYQDWVPFLWNVAFTVLSHGLGSGLRTDLIFNHHAAQSAPWQWSAIHGAAVLVACAGVIVFWKHTELEQLKALRLTRELSDAKIERERFTSNLLVNLARRNQSLLYRQLELINRLEDAERDADALAELFQLDHLATRIRRNGESLLVLSGEDPARTWAGPVLLVDVVRAAIAEIEDMERVEFVVDERLAIAGHAVADLTHLVAELVENAASFSPPDVQVSVRCRPYLNDPGAWVLVVEDWGVGMRESDLDEANRLLRSETEVDLSTSARLGLHVVARLARRYGIEVSLGPTPGSGLTAAVVLPAGLFTDPGADGRRNGHGQRHTVAGRGRSGASPARPGRRAALADAFARRPAAAAVAEPPPLESRLERRVPQANLAPQLRRNGDGQPF
jgi:signal transduction histidine kinase